MEKHRGGGEGRDGERVRKINVVTVEWSNRRTCALPLIEVIVGAVGAMVVEDEEDGHCSQHQHLYGAT